MILLAATTVVVLALSILVLRSISPRHWTHRFAGFGRPKRQPQLPSEKHTEPPDALASVKGANRHDDPSKLTPSFNILTTADVEEDANNTTSLRESVGPLGASRTVEEISKVSSQAMDTKSPTRSQGPQTVTNAKQSTPGSRLMPPPQRLPAASARQPSSTDTVSSSLRVPTTGPLPNRLPPASSSLSSSKPVTLLTPNAAINSSSDPRKKVILQPGHSPLDWANLTKSGKNLSGVERLTKVTPSQLAFHNGRKGRPAWSSWQGKVYNITPYMAFHPGGEDQLRRGAGKSSDKLFMEVHPWVNWENMLGECLVGILVSEKHSDSGPGKSLDDMD